MAIMTVAKKKFILPRGVRQLCKCLETKHVFIFEETAEGGKKKFKIGQLHLKVETLSLKIKKKLSSTIIFNEVMII